MYPFHSFPITFDRIEKPIESFVIACGLLPVLKIHPVEAVNSQRWPALDYHGGDYLFSVKASHADLIQAYSFRAPYGMWREKRYEYLTSKNFELNLLFP